MVRVSRLIGILVLCLASFVQIAGCQDGDQSSTVRDEIKDLADSVSLTSERRDDATGDDNKSITYVGSDNLVWLDLEIDTLKQLISAYETKIDLIKESLAEPVDAEMNTGEGQTGKRVSKPQRKK